MEEIIIDPTQLNEQTKPLLQALLNSSPQKKLYAWETYTVELSSPLRTVRIPICLTHFLLRHAKEDYSFQDQVEIFDQFTNSEGRVKNLKKRGALDLKNNLYFKVEPEGKKKIQHLIELFESFAPQKSLDPRPTQAFSINPTELDDETRPLLQAFLDSTAKTRLLPGKIYWVELHSTAGLVKIPFRLTHALLIRPRQSNPLQYRAEIFGHSISSGTFGNVYDSLGVLEFENDLFFKVKPEGKERIIKVIQLDNSEKIQKRKEKPIRKEALKTNLASDFLHCKSALFSKHAGYLVMRKAPGDELFSIITEFREKKINLTVHQLLYLTLKLIEAVQTIHAKGIVHRDLKPENIIVDLKTMLVTIIDHASNRKLSGVEFCKYQMGTLVFMSHEAIETKEVSYAGDLYALGLIIAQLWGDTKLDEFVDRGKVDKSVLLSWQKKENRFNGLFANMEVSATIKMVITSIIYDLTRYDSRERLELTKAASRCKTLLLQESQKSTNNAHRDNVKSNMFTLSKARWKVCSEQYQVTETNEGNSFAL